MTRDELGRLVREAWVKYCLETGDTKPSHIAPYDELSEWDKEADRRIGEAVIAAFKSSEDGKEIEKLQAELKEAQDDASYYYEQELERRRYWIPNYR